MPLVDRLVFFAAALWWGSLSVVGPMVVPLLFANLPSKPMAGHAAAHLFAAQTWVSVACGLVIVLVAKRGDAVTLVKGRYALVMLAVLGMLLALLLNYGVAPRIVMRDNLRLWHGMGSVFYAVQWLCAAAVLWRLVGGLRTPAEY